MPLDLTQRLTSVVLSIKHRTDEFWPWGSLFKPATQKPPVLLTAPIFGMQGSPDRHMGGPSLVAPYSVGLAP